MFREETPEILEIKNHLLNWSSEQWKIFKNETFTYLPVIEYAFLLFDVGFNPKTDSVEKASELMGY